MGLRMNHCPPIFTRLLSHATRFAILGSPVPLQPLILGKRVDYVSVGQTVAKYFVKPVDCVAGGEGGIRTRPNSNPSCYQGDGENLCEHWYFSTSRLSPVSQISLRLTVFSVFLELMELMHPFLFKWNLYAASDAPRAFHNIGTMPGNSAHVAESFSRTSASFLNRDILIQPRMLPCPTRSSSSPKTSFRASRMP